MLINQKAEIINKTENKIDNIANIARVCYKSESKANNESNVRLVKNLISNKHFAMLEHEEIIFKLNDLYEFNNFIEMIGEIEYTFGINLYLVKTINKDEKYGIVSGNIKAWRDFFEYVFKWAELNEVKELYLFAQNFNIFFEDAFKKANEKYKIHNLPLHIDIITKNDLKTDIELLSHYRVSAKIITDRGISHELVRHRTFSFAQESTRYVNYNKKGVEFIDYSKYNKLNNPMLSLLTSMNNEATTDNYNGIINNGYEPQLARGVLPHNLKTELVMTGNLHSWCHFFNLRLFEKTGKVHPMMKDIANQLFIDFEEKTPITQGKIINLCEYLWS